MSLSHWIFRRKCDAIRLRGKRKLIFAWIGLAVGVMVTLSLALLSEGGKEIEGKDASILAALSRWHVWVPGVSTLAAGIAGNLWAAWIQYKLDTWPRNALAAPQNHHLANLVGEAVRVILLLLVDSKPPPHGMSKEDFSGSVTGAAKGPLTDMAAAATDFWRGLVLDADPKKVEPFAGLHEPALSRFIIDPRALAMKEDAWVQFLEDLNKFAQKKTGRTAEPFDHPADRTATIAMLNEQFGRSFREALKWDSTHDGLGWAAMQLQIAGQLLERASVASKDSLAVTGALAALRTTYDTGFKKLSTQIDNLETKQRRRHIAVMARLSQQHKQIMDKIEALIAPGLVLPIKETNKAGQEVGRFVFGNERLSLVGRETELRELLDWTTDARQFSWDLWTGPAGAGKSRLALALCRKLGNWRCGFFDFATAKTTRWDQWLPRKDTLVVFDYVGEDKEDAVATAVRQLCQRTLPAAEYPLPSGIKVRVLLLEREIVHDSQLIPGIGPVGEPPPPAWLRNILTIKNASLVESHADPNKERPKTRPVWPERAIAGVNDNALELILQEDHQHAEHEAGRVLTPLDANTLRDRLAILKKIDPRDRPLFAAMTAEAIRVQGASFKATHNQSGVDAVVNYIVNKEYNRYPARLAGVGDGIEREWTDWARLVCLATMCGHLSHDKLTEALIINGKLGLPGQKDWHNGTPYGTLVSGATGNFAPALQPDIIGEAFVLFVLKNDSQMAELLVSWAWQVGMRPFLARASQNFPLDEQFDSLLKVVASKNLAADRAFAASVRSSLATQASAMGRLSLALKHVDAAINLQSVVVKP